MIQHRHVYILFYSDTEVQVLIKRINTENKYQLKDLTFSSKERLEELLKTYTPAISFHSQLVFWDAIKYIDK
jgi:hypothetical protein